jgi:hypothetical protein
VGGSGSGFPTSRRDIEALQQEVQSASDELQKAQINALLATKLAAINDRDTDKIQNSLEDIQQALGDEFDVEGLLFGGSVAKHTFVDGLSDVDSLIILDSDAYADQSPESVRDAFAAALDASLPKSDVDSVRAGQLAVTITYRDGTEIQLLPALRSGDELKIASPDAKSWSSTDPRAFANALTDTNKQQRGQVIPAIKLTKSILATQITQDPLAGYHVEALALAAFRDYNGPRDPRSMVTALVTSAANNVLKPIRDVTGQSPFVDERLGAANSEARKTLATKLRRVSEQMERVQGPDEWRKLLGE